MRCCSIEAHDIDHLLNTWLLLIEEIRPRNLKLTTSLPHLTMLRWLVRRGPFSVSEIADISNVSPSAITQACKKLEREGLIKRRRDERDQRVVWLDVTEKGRGEVRVLELAQRERLSSMLRVLSPDQKDMLETLLDAVAEPIRERRRQGRSSHE